MRRQGSPRAALRRSRPPRRLTRLPPALRLPGGWWRPRGPAPGRTRPGCREREVTGVPYWSVEEVRGFVIPEQYVELSPRADVSGGPVWSDGQRRTSPLLTGNG